MFDANYIATLIRAYMDAQDTVQVYLIPRI